MKTMDKTFVALAAAMLSATVSAQELNVFEANEPAVAEEVNENFELLEERIEALEQGGGTIDMASLAGGYRFHISGAMYEFRSPYEFPEEEPQFDNYDEDGEKRGPHEEFAQREYLITGDLTLNGDGTGNLDIRDEMEMQVFLQNWGDLDQDIEFIDETFVDLDLGPGGPDVNWGYNATDNIIDLTIDTGDGEWPIELHVSRDQNTLLGAQFVQEHKLDGEWRRDYEQIQFTGVRMPD